MNLHVKISSWLCLTAVLTVLSWHGVAHADPGDAVVFGRIEPAIGIPLSAPQSDRFYPGLHGMIDLGVGLSHVDLKLTGLLLALPGRSNAASSEGTTVGGVGGGIRFRLFQDPLAITPWIDLGALYTRSANLDRFAYSIGLGLQVPVRSRPLSKFGPVVRFTSVTNPSDQEGFDDRNAYILSIGLSVEFDIATVWHRSDTARFTVPIKHSVAAR